MSYRRSRYYSRRRQVSTEPPRFYHFRGMTARFDSKGCVNGEDHEIKAGHWIGWSRAHRLACCADCWAKWVAENQEAEDYERGLGPEFAPEPCEQW